MELGAKMSTKSSLKISLFLGTALGSALLWGGPSVAQQAPSSAQQAPSSAQQQEPIEEVVVTARGRAEQLQNVPIADTAFSEQQIEDAHIHEVGDFINLTPNVTIVQAQSSGYSSTTIRGITQSRNGESPVAVIVDGVEEVNPYQFPQELFDLESIEVLKGPQGALYGRDAEGGAILITTQQPTNQFEGHIDVGGGTGGEIDTQGVVSGPIIEDQLFFRVGFNYVNRDGYFQNVFLGQKEDPFHDENFQGLLKWTPTSKFTADLRISRSATNSGAVDYHLEAANAPSNLTSAGLWNGTFNGNPPDANYVNDQFNSYYRGSDHRDIDEISLKLDYDLGFADLRSITGWNQLTDWLGGMGYPYENTTSIPATGGLDNYQTQYLDVNATSEELRLTSNSDQRLRWMGGVYYLATDRFISTTVDTNNGTGMAMIEHAPVAATESFLADNNHNNAWAGFANVDYDILPQLQLSAAYRYDQDIRVQVVSPYQNTGLAATTHPGIVNRATFGLGQPKFTATYKADPDLTFYGSWGVGFRSGEFNQNGIAAILGTGASDKVPQESATTAEVGFKSSWFDDHLKVSADVFRTNVQNQEYFVFEDAVGAQVLIPIQKVLIQGGELEAQALLAPGLDVYSSIGFSSSSIQEYLLNPADVGHWAPYVPNMTFNAGAQYRTDVIKDTVSIVARVDYRLLGKQYWDPEDSTPRNTVNLVDLSIGLEDDKGVWSASVKASNLFDTKYNAEFVDGGFTEPAPPRVILGNVRYNF